MRRVMRHVGLSLLAIALACTGCETVQSPEARVAQVAVTERTPAGTRVEVTLEVANPNDVALPVREADYAVAVSDLGTFRFASQPPVSLPPNGVQTIVLSAAFADGDVPVAGRRYEVSGTVRYQPPGQIRELLTEYRVPLPAVMFDEAGAVE